MRIVLLTRSRSGWDVTCYFCSFVPELWPLIDVSILFPLNVFRTNGLNLTKVCICFDIYKSRFRRLPFIFLKFVTELWPLIDIRTLGPLYILSTNG